MQKKYKMHVISGTHWDREWRHTAEQSKLRLVDLMDSTMNILENNKDYLCFCVDGGTVIIEDYLTVRPENEERLKNLIEKKKMQFVSWYTLPETFTVAPEALIRNLLTGISMAKKYGGAIKTGYTATSYGQVSQLPQIYSGFGLKTAMFYRGTNKHVLPPFFKWQSPDGTEIHVHKTFDDVTRTNWFFYAHQPLVLGKKPRDTSYTYDSQNVPVHLCDEGLYERMFTLLKETPGFNKNPEALKEALDYITTHTKEYAVNNHLLALNLEDNDKPFNLLPEMIEELNKFSDEVEIVQNSFDNYIEEVTASLEEKDLYTHKGELRYTAIERGGWGGLLGATHSSRIKLKLMNDQAETGLLYYAEPYASIASFFGREYPKKYLERAWYALLKNHAHDSICGAALEQAHKDMEYGFSIARTVSEEVTARSIASIFSNIDSSKDFEDCANTITLLNPLNIKRKEIVPVIIDLPESEKEFFDILDNKGDIIDYELLSSENIRMTVERELDTTTTFPVTRKRMLLNVSVPQMGYTTLGLKTREPKYIADPRPMGERKLIARPNGILENDFIKVTFNSNGTFNLLNKETGKVIESLHYFTDSGEIGGAHSSVKPQRNQIYTSLGCSASISMMESNTLRGVFKVDLIMKIPSSATDSDRGENLVELPVSSWVSLCKNESFLRIRTRINNNARDHKLCVNLPTQVKTDDADVESAFSIERRPILWTNTGDNAEGFYPFQPMQNFIDLSDGKEGLAIMAKGLREYEVSDDEARTVAITLLRTHRSYMTANSVMTPEESHKYTGVHSFGELEYQYAIYPHTGNWESGKVLEQAYKFKMDLKAIQGVPVKGGLESTGSFIRIEPEGKVILSALKSKEDGTGIILRFWNPTGETQNIHVSTVLPVHSVERLNLKEDVIETLGSSEGKFNMTVMPYKIETLLLSK